MQYDEVYDLLLSTGPFTAEVMMWNMTHQEKNRVELVHVEVLAALPTCDELPYTC